MPHTRLPIDKLRLRRRFCMLRFQYGIEKGAREPCKGRSVIPFFEKIDSLHIEKRIEQPYAFRYELTMDDVPQSKTEMGKIDCVLITNMRTIQDKLSLEVNGFEIAEIESKLSYDDSFDPGKAEIYFRELERLLQLRLGASKVEVFRYGVQQRAYWSYKDQMLIKAKPGKSLQRH